MDFSSMLSCIGYLFLASCAVWTLMHGAFGPVPFVYSDPDEKWLASPEGQADAFANDPWQWLDTDGDGYGDNPVGNLRDDCPSDSGSSTIDFQGCPDNNGDGYSNSFGEIKAAMTIMGSNPLSSWATYAIAGLIFLFAVIVNRIFEENDETKEVDFIEQI